jgi:hypothetical protein
MDRLTEYFTPVKLVELNTDLSIKFVPYDRDKGWEHNRLHYESRERPAFARQALEVYSKREALAKIALMIEELKAIGIQEKLEEIRKFARDNGVDSMVDFCAWGNEFDDFDSILESNPVDSAFRWMASTQDC